MILYKRTTTGKIQTWQQEIDCDKYRTHTGQLDGKKTISEWVVCHGKNLGKANETTGEQQAIKEVEANYKKKLTLGSYVKSIDEIDVPTYFKPMLAHKYQDYKDNLDFSKEIFVNPKLDGCLHEDTLVKTSIGDIKIKDVKIGMDVFTFNEFNETQELKKVLGVYKNGIDINETKTEWFEITLENDLTITLTGNHRIWVDNLKCWRRVDELDGTEDLKIYHQV